MSSAYNRDCFLAFHEKYGTIQLSIMLSDMYESGDYDSDELYDLSHYIMKADTETEEMNVVTCNENFHVLVVGYSELAVHQPFIERRSDGSISILYFAPPTEDGDVILDKWDKRSKWTYAVSKLKKYSEQFHNGDLEYTR